MAVHLHSQEEIGKMRLACRLAAQVLEFIEPHVVPGVTTGELNALCHDYMVNVQKVIPAPLNYAPRGRPPYPGSICTSVNHQVCHGIPGKRKLKEGDIVNLDITVIKDGFHGDTSSTFIAGKASPLAKKLVETARLAMWAGIGEVRPGARLGDVGHAVQSVAEKAGFSVVREFCGHGVGRRFHQEPQVLHYGRRGEGLELLPGMIFTIEPMVNAGGPEVRELGDGWTVVTKDHSLSAQWEHTIVVTENGREVLTLRENETLSDG